MAGKGDKWRKGLDFKEYQKKFEEIDFSKGKKPRPKKVEKKNGRTRYVFG